jgi:hypothetical protein
LATSVGGLFHFSNHSCLYRAHDSLRSTPALALGVVDRVWTIGDLLDAALATAD